MKTKAMFVLLIALLLLLSCKKETQDMLFSKWLQEGNYSIFKCSDALEPNLSDSVMIMITGTDDYFLDYTYYNGIATIDNTIGNDCSVDVTTEGFMMKRSCETFMTSYVYIPSNPELEASWNHYNCNDDIIGTSTVVEVDKEITVPEGTYKTFVIKEDAAAYNRYAYYHKDYGLIKIQVYSVENEEITANFELVEKNF